MSGLTCETVSNALDAETAPWRERDARHRADRNWTLEATIGAADRFARAVARHVDAGEGDEYELAQLVALAATVALAIDVLAIRMRAEGWSNQQLADVLGLTRQGVHERYKLTPTARRPGGQPAGQR